MSAEYMKNGAQLNTNSLQTISDVFFDHSKVISLADIPFDPEVRKLCEQNSCGKFGTCWTCPPAVGTLKELHARIMKFDHFLLFDKVYELEDSFDWEGMMTSVKDFQKRIFKYKKEVHKKDSAFSFLTLGAGACMFCETCTYGQQIPCRFPEEALISVEAFGIDAMKMMKDNGLKYNNGPNTVTYIGGIFY